MTTSYEKLIDSRLKLNSEFEILQINFWCFVYGLEVDLQLIVEKLIETEKAL